MIELALVVCSIVEGAKCKDVSLVYADVSMITCMVAAQPQIAAWAEGHPNWKVTRWSCRVPGQYAKI